MTYGIDSAALDRYITGNYGEDRPMVSPRCERCRDDHLAEDPEWACRLDYDDTTCISEEQADAIYDRMRDGGL